jgi:hypothetical protein
MKKITLTLAAIALIFSASCSKNAIVKNVGSDLQDLPAWVLEPSMIDGVPADGIASVGIASPSRGGIKFQIPKASLDAKANIAATIQAELTRVTKASLRSAKVNENDDVEEFFAQATKEVVKDIPLSGVKRINIFKSEDGTLYVHMLLGNEDYSKFLANSEKTFEARLAKANLGRENINKSQAASKELFDELEKERKN